MLCKMSGADLSMTSFVMKLLSSLLINVDRQTPCCVFLLDFQIYLRIPLHPREDLAEWRSVLQNIMESSAAATRLLLCTLSSHSQLRRRQVLLEETIVLGLVRRTSSKTNVPVCSTANM